MNKLSNYCLKTGFFCALVAMLLSGIGFSSCSTPKNTYYFKTVPRDTSIYSMFRRVEESKIRKNDLLAINISSLNPQEDLTYNAAGGIGTSSAPGASGTGYLVDATGNIQLRKLGFIYVEGMTRRELKDTIQNYLEPYLKDPVVTVRYLNHRITVLGEVAQPTIIQMPEERLSILEVLSSSGDLTQFGKRDNILIIRETPDGKELKRVNLENHSIFTSEWYYLQPDDIVYVEPSDKKMNEEVRGKRLQTAGLVLSGLSVAVLVLDRVFSKTPR